ncbi:terminase gpP N-terminus-related DNA-binding protein [Escherichia coli]
MTRDGRHRCFYWQGFSVPQIAEMLQVKRPTVQSWKQRDGWDGIAPISRVESSLEARLIQLIAKPQKSGGDFKEIDLLGRQIERLARVNRYSQTGNEVDLNPNVANRNKGERKKPKKNFFSDEAIDKLEELFFDQSFEYQLQWYRRDWSTVFVTFSNPARLARHSISPARHCCAHSKPAITRYFYQPVKRRLTCSANTSSSLRDWSTLT